MEIITKEAVYKKRNGLKNKKNEISAIPTKTKHQNNKNSSYQQKQINNKKWVYVKNVRGDSCLRGNKKMIANKYIYIQ